MEQLVVKLFKLTQFDVFQNAPQGPGAYCLCDGEGKLVYVAWTEDLSQQLMKHLPANERNPDLKGKAKQFRVVQCEDAASFVGVFDGIVERTGMAPSVRSCIPEGSRFTGGEGPAAQLDVQALLAKVERMYAAEDVDGALQALLQAGTAGEGVVEYHLLCGKLMAVKGFLSAVKQFEQAAVLDPTSPGGIKAAALAERCQDLLVGFQKI